MADNFQASKVASNELSSSAKFNNFVQAVEDAINSLDNSNISAAAAIVVSKLASGSNGDVLTTSAGVPVWAPSVGAPGYSTSLPGAPTNGQEHILVDSTTAPTYAWRLRYNSAKSSNKWDFVGGASIYAEITTGETTTSTSYVALTTPGPSIALPVAGDYFVATGFSVVTNAKPGVMSYDIGGTGAVDADGTLVGVATVVDSGGSFHRERKKLALTAVTLTAKYKTTTGGNTTGFSNRWMCVTPIAIGG